MRMTLLPTVALFGLAFGVPALAQQDTAPPPAAAPDTGSPAPDTAAPATMAPDTSTPTRPRHHNHVVQPASGGDGENWAHEPGTGESGPASNKASNIDEADSHSEIAPHLPSPSGGANAGWRNYLREADQALETHRTGLAQQSLEMAETRLLDRSTPVGLAGAPDSSPTIQRVAEARRALASGNTAAAHDAIRMALASAPNAAEDAAESAR